MPSMLYNRVHLYSFTCVMSGLTPNCLKLYQVSFLHRNMATVILSWALHAALGEGGQVQGLFTLGHWCDHSSTTEAGWGVLGDGRKNCRFPTSKPQPMPHTTMRTHTVHAAKPLNSTTCMYTKQPTCASVSAHQYIHYYDLPKRGSYSYHM